MYSRYSQHTMNRKRVSSVFGVKPNLDFSLGSKHVTVISPIKGSTEAFRLKWLDQLMEMGMSKAVKVDPMLVSQ